MPPSVMYVAEPQSEAKPHGFGSLSVLGDVGDGLVWFGDGIGEMKQGSNTYHMPASSWTTPP